MPLALLLGNWKLIALGLAVAAALVYHFIALSSAREDGRNQIRAEVRAVVAKQNAAIKDATVKQLGKLYDEERRRNKVLQEGLRTIEAEGGDCPVTPALRDAIRRMRDLDGPSED